MVAGEAPRPAPAPPGDRPADRPDPAGRRGPRAAVLDGTPTTRRGSACCRARAAAPSVRWFEIDPCYVFHTLNAYEEGSDVIIDVVRHDRMFATDLANGPGVPHPVHDRHRGRQGARHQCSAQPGVPPVRRSGSPVAGTATGTPPARRRDRRTHQRLRAQARPRGQHHRRTPTGRRPPRSASSARCRRRRTRPRTRAC